MSQRWGYNVQKRPKTSDIIQKILMGIPLGGILSIGLSVLFSTTYRRILAEREGFEPSVRLPLHTLSKRAPSTTRTPLLIALAISFQVYLQ